MVIFNFSFHTLWFYTPIFYFNNYLQDSEKLSIFAAKKGKI